MKAVKSQFCFFRVDREGEGGGDVEGREREKGGSEILGVQGGMIVSSKDEGDRSNMEMKQRIGEEDRY